MRHFYKHILSGIVFWLILSQSLSMFNGSTAASAASRYQEMAEEDLESQQTALENEEEGSEGRYFGDLIKLVKRQLNDVETGRSSSGIFNTTLAFTIPLFSFNLPDRATAGKDYTKQAAWSLIGLAAVGGIAILPYVWTARGSQKKDKTILASASSRAYRDDLASSILPLLTNAASLAGLDPSKCLQRSVCESYREPGRYGFLTYPVRYFMLGQKSREDNSPNDYQAAAEFGRQSKEDCEKRYRCAFSLIGAANFLVSYFRPSASETASA